MNLKNWIWAFIAVLLIRPQNLRAEGDGIVFIVNIKNPAAELSEANVRDYYFKKKRQWPDGESVRFIDRAAGSGLRAEFLREILKKSASDVDLYWIGQKLYTGDSAPLREASDGATEQFVSSFPGAIGYLSSAAMITSKNVKVIKIKDE